MHALVIDSFEYCRLQERREGELEISGLSRLAGELADSSGVLHWVLQGGFDRLGHAQLLLSVSASVQLKCQRCLTSFAFDVVSESKLIVAKDEAQADEIDALLDEDEFEVIVGSRALNVVELIEDEVLLAIPLASKHDVCPGRGESEVQAVTDSRSPFAVLINIKQ